MHRLRRVQQFNCRSEQNVVPSKQRWSPFRTVAMQRICLLEISVLHADDRVLQ